MPPLDVISVKNTINDMTEYVEKALETANYDQLLQSGLQVISSTLAKGVNWWFILHVCFNLVFFFLEKLVYLRSKFVTVISCHNILYNALTGLNMYISLKLEDYLFFFCNVWWKFFGTYALSSCWSLTLICFGEYNGPHIRGLRL